MESKSMISNSLYADDCNKRYGVESLNQTKSDCEDCANPVCIHNTTDKQRGKLLKEYLDSLPVDPLLMPLSDNKRPKIQKKGIALDSDKGQELLVTPEEAIQRLESGENGFALYAGKPTHNTQELVFADHDDLDKFSLDTLPDTLTVMSGSGQGYHETYLKDGEIENAKAKGDMSGAGEIRALNWYVVTPGSIHPSDGIYHTVNQRDLETLSNDLIPSNLQKQTYCSDEIETEINKSELESLTVESDTLDIGIQYLNEWKNGNMSAFYCLSDRLKGGRGDYGSELSKEEGSKIDRDLQEKTIITHLYGIYHNQGYSDSRAKELANTVLAHYIKEEPHTKDGQARKWAKRGVDYRSEQIRYAGLQYDKDRFRAFENKTTKATTRLKRKRNEYSGVTRGICLFAVDVLSGVYENQSPEEVYEYVLPEYGFSLKLDEVTALFNADHIYNDIRGSSNTSNDTIDIPYPKKSKVLEVCKLVDGVYKGGRSKGTFRECLKRLQREGKMKAAVIKQGTDNIRYYPYDFEDPTQAEFVRYKGEVEA